MPAAEPPAAEQPRTGLWWVNQGRFYEQELAAGVVFAGSGGPQVAHHRDVARMEPCDVVLHYRRGLLVALGEVVASPVQARRPYGERAERDDGWLTRVEYFPLERPIPLADLPERSASGPCNAAGGVRQGYLFALDHTFGDQIRDAFHDRWPAGSPWAAGDRHFWLFQLNPRQLALLGRLRPMPSGDLMDRTVTRHRHAMRPGDGVVLWGVGNTAAIVALGRLHGVPGLREGPAVHPATGEQEYRVDLVIERHLQPPITTRQIHRDPDLAALEVLHGPWGGTNLPVTVEQWRAVRRLLPLGPAGSQYRAGLLGADGPRQPAQPSRPGLARLPGWVPDPGWGPDHPGGAAMKSNTIKIHPAHRMLHLYDRTAGMGAPLQFPHTPDGNEPSPEIWAWSGGHQLLLRTATDLGSVFVTLAVVDGVGVAVVPPGSGAELVYSGPMRIPHGDMWLNAPSTANEPIMKVPPGDYRVRVMMSGREAAIRAEEQYRTVYPSGLPAPTAAERDAILPPYERIWVILTLTAPAGAARRMQPKPPSARVEMREPTPPRSLDIVGWSTGSRQPSTPPSDKGHET